MSGALEFLLRLQAEGGGAIPVERYMQEALYHPEYGYYARNIRTVGRRGDFATSASLGEALGSGLARWLRTHRPSGARWNVIEAGAGTGELARTVLRRLGLWGRRGLTYHIVETSPVLRAEQQKALPQFRVAWHDSMAAALAACEGRALIFSNELVDAFPCRVFQCREGGWMELGVRIESGRIVECDYPRPLPDGLPTEATEGQRIEFHAAAAEWIASWAAAAQDCRMLTIDYGDTMPALYHRRPRGTLRAYFHHQRYEGLEIYHRFGKQDLTADVNFTSLRDWTERCGWKTNALTTQAEFLARYGAVHAGLHDAQLADHTGAGAAFKVLESERHAAAPLPSPSPALPQS
ncbi:MAG TPA: SAM-dependent methyltransferase [Chthoniobacterales bacterium]|nr:SAM-dependent methyltransferase [Chthoniobacterales bacterium]